MDRNENNRAVVLFPPLFYVVTNYNEVLLIWIEQIIGTPKITDVAKIHSFAGDVRSDKSADIACHILNMCKNRYKVVPIYLIYKKIFI